MKNSLDINYGLFYYVSMKVFFGILLSLAAIALAGAGLWRFAVLPLVLGCYLMLSYERELIEALPFDRDED